MPDVNTGAPPMAGALDSVGFLLSQLGFAMAGRFRRTLAPLGLEPRQFFVLRHVALDEGRSQQALAEALHIPASRVVGILDGLESRGLVERRPNPADRRVRALHVTPEGRRVLGRAVELAVEHEQTVCSALSVEQRAQLISLLRAIATEHALVPGVHPGLAEEC